MRRLATDIIVIGGGATGTGLVRDLAMRGFKTILVEKGDLASGTTGRFHGLLHSGGRYVVKDPQAASECIEENRILRKIMPFCIEDTGGLFVLTPWDDPNYVSQFISGCKTANIPCEETKLKDIFTEEPLLNRDILRAFHLPDASVDSFIAAEANALSAKNYGAQVLTYHPVTELILKHRRVHGVICHDLFKDEFIEITADHVVNAAGAWADSILASAGIQIKMILGKGTMVAINHRIVNTVINRCKMPADGDIIVPSHTVSVLGTTDIPVPDPDHYATESWEVDLIIQECQKVVPSASRMRFLRAWAGVRPLYQPDIGAGNRDITRAFVLLDHAERDGVESLTTITSGKWTTYRKMAEKTADLVCLKLGSPRKCRTHLEVLPNPEFHKQKNKYHFLGSRLQSIEKEKNYGQIICECELVTVDDVIDAWTRRQAFTLSDLRRDTRLGMGPCQGGFCTLRAAGIGHKIGKLPVQTINQMMVEYVEERWKGVKPVLWGQQLKQEYLNAYIFKGLLQLHRLQPSNAGDIYTNHPEYESPHVDGSSGDQDFSRTETVVAAKPRMHTKPIRRTMEFDVVAIGMGLAGLVAAWRLAMRGLRVAVIAKGMGSLFFSSGCIDLLGYHNGEQVISPMEKIEILKATTQNHPYNRFQQSDFTQVFAQFAELCAQAGMPMAGGIQHNWLLPTAIGASRPTSLVPSTMSAGDLHSKQSILVVGIKNFFDFFPGLISENLIHLDIPCKSGEIEIPRTGKDQNWNARRLANSFEEKPFLHTVRQQLFKLLEKLKPFLPERIALPAVLGTNPSQGIFNELQAEVGIPLCEIPTLPPSIPGIRLHKVLTQKINENGGTIINGAQVVSAESNCRKITRIFSEAAAGFVEFQAKEYILATGGILGGGISRSFGENYKEPIFNLPITTRNQQRELANPSLPFMAPQAFLPAGITTNACFQPIDEQGEILFDNLHCIGLNLYGVDPVNELSGEGVALMTGAWIGNHIL
jgi:glycerol-3-phosphate dehydrogenase